MPTSHKRSLATRRFTCGLLLMVCAVTLPSAATNAQPVTLGDAVDNTSLTWTTGGDAEWYGQTEVFFYDGDAARSGDLAWGRESWIQTVVSGPGLLAFHWRVSALIAVSSLKFHVDGVEQAVRLHNNQWEQRTLSIATGSHTLRWSYTQVLAPNAGFLDKVTYVTGPAIAVESPNGGEVWQHRDYRTIAWQSIGEVGADVGIDLYKGGIRCRTIASSTSNDGTYRWLVPLAVEPGTDYRVRVTSASNPTVYDDGDGTFSTEDSYQSGFGGLLDLDGTDDYAEAVDHPELEVGDEVGESLTLEAWINYQGDGTVISKAGRYGLRVYRFGESCGWPYYWCVYGCIGFKGGGHGEVVHCKHPAPFGPGWHHIAGVFYRDTGKISIYLNGQRLTGPSLIGTALSPSGEALRAGSSFNGALDEVRISDVARYTGETYTKPTSPFACDEHTRALWHFDEFQGGTRFRDSCGTVDNTLVGYNGAHCEGLSALRTHLPRMVKH